MFVVKYDVVQYIKVRLHKRLLLIWQNMRTENKLVYKIVLTKKAKNKLNINVILCVISFVVSYLSILSKTSNYCNRKDYCISIHTTSISYRIDFEGELSGNL